MNNLSDIVNVQIEIEEPVTNSASFNNMLIVGPQPEIYDYDANAKDPKVAKLEGVRSVYSATSYSGVIDIVRKITGFPVKKDIQELIDWGGKIDVLDAARVAFAQAVPPAKIYIAFNRFANLDDKGIAKTDVKNCAVVLARNAEELSNALDGANVVDDEESPIAYPVLVLRCSPGDSDNVAITYEITKGDEAINPTATTSDGAIRFAERSLGTNFAGNYTVKISRKNTVFTAKFEIVSASGVAEFKNTPEYHYDIPRESVSNTITNAIETPGWYVVCPTYTDPDVIYRLDEIVSAQTATKKMLAYPVFGDIESTDNAYNENTNPHYNWNDLVGNKSFRSFGIYAGTRYGQTAEELIKTTDADNRYLHIAWCAKMLNHISGSETWVHKKLVGMQPCELTRTEMDILSGTQQGAAYGCNVSYYTTYGDRDITQGGKVNYGEWIDVIRFRDWLENDMQYRIFDVLAKNVKVPYTDEGIALIKNQMIASLKEGQKNGGIAPTEFDADDEEIPGFVVTVPLAANIPDSVKKSRVLYDCKFRARLAGAIHVVNVYGVLAYSLND